MKFKTKRVEKEYAQLKEENPRLFAIAEKANSFFLEKFGRELTITSLLRTQEEHEALYAKTEPSKRPASSPHMVWNALDFRSKDMSGPEIAALLEHLNQNVVWGGKRKCAIYHTIPGNVRHFHVQAPKVEA